MGETLTCPISVDSEMKSFGDEDINIPFCAGSEADANSEVSLPLRRTAFQHDGHKVCNARKKTCFSNPFRLADEADTEKKSSRNCNLILKHDKPESCGGLSDRSISDNWSETSGNRRNLFNSIEIHERSIITVKPSDEVGSHSVRKKPKEPKQRFQKPNKSNGSGFTSRTSFSSNRSSNDRILAYCTAEDPRKIRKSVRKPVGEITAVFEKLDPVRNTFLRSKTAKDKKLHLASSANRLKSTTPVNRDSKTPCQSKIRNGKTTKRACASDIVPSKERNHEWLTPRVLMAIEDHTVKRAWCTSETVVDMQDFDVCTTSSQRICLMTCPDVRTLAAGESTDDERSWKTVDKPPPKPKVHPRINRGAVHIRKRQIVDKKEQWPELLSLKKKRKLIRENLIKARNINNYIARGKKTTSQNCPRVQQKQSDEILLPTKGFYFSDEAAFFKQLKDENKCDSDRQNYSSESERNDIGSSSSEPSSTSTVLSIIISNNTNNASSQNIKSDLPSNSHNDTQTKEVDLVIKTPSSTSTPEHSTDNLSEDVQLSDGSKVNTKPKNVAQTQQMADLNHSRAMTLNPGNEEKSISSPVIGLSGIRDVLDRKKTSTLSLSERERRKRFTESKTKSPGK